MSIELQTIAVFVGLSVAVVLAFFAFCLIVEFVRDWFDR